MDSNQKLKRQSASSVESPASPCVRNCCLDGDDVCVGCGRHINEITGWSAASPQQQWQIVAKAKQRLAK